MNPKYNRIVFNLQRKIKLSEIDKNNLKRTETKECMMTISFPFIVYANKCKQ